MFYVDHEPQFGELFYQGVSLPGGEGPIVGEEVRCPACHAGVPSPIDLVRIQPVIAVPESEVQRRESEQSSEQRSM